MSTQSETLTKERLTQVVNDIAGYDSDYGTEDFWSIKLNGLQDHIVQIAKYVYKEYESQFFTLEEDTLIGRFTYFLYRNYANWQDFYILRPAYVKYARVLLTESFCEWAIEQIVRYIPSTSKGGRLKRVPNTLSAPTMNKVFPYLPYQTESMALRAVSVDGMLLRDVKPELRTKQVSYVAVNQDAGAIRYVPQPQPLDIALLAITKDVNLIHSAPIELGSQELVDQYIGYILDRNGVTHVPAFSNEMNPSLFVKQAIKDKAIRVGIYPIKCGETFDIRTVQYHTVEPSKLLFTDQELLAMLANARNNERKSFIFTLFSEKFYSSVFEGTADGVAPLIQGLVLSFNDIRRLKTRFPVHFRAWAQANPELLGSV